MADTGFPVPAVYDLSAPAIPNTAFITTQTPDDKFSIVVHVFPYPILPHSGRTFVLRVYLDRSLIYASRCGSSGKYVELVARPDHDGKLVPFRFRPHEAGEVRAEIWVAEIVVPPSREAPSPSPSSTTPFRNENTLLFKIIGEAPIGLRRICYNWHPPRRITKYFAHDTSRQTAGHQQVGNIYGEAADSFAQRAKLAAGAQSPELSTSTILEQPQRALLADGPASFTQTLPYTPIEDTGSMNAPTTNAPTAVHDLSPVCSNCNTGKTFVRRRNSLTSEPLCSACAYSGMNPTGLKKHVTHTRMPGPAPAAETQVHKRIEAGMIVPHTMLPLAPPSLPSGDNAAAAAAASYGTGGGKYPMFTRPFPSSNVQLSSSSSSPFAAPYATDNGFKPVFPHRTPSSNLQMLLSSSSSLAIAAADRAVPPFKSISTQPTLNPNLHMVSSSSSLYTGAARAPAVAAAASYVTGGSFNPIFTQSIPSQNLQILSSSSSLFPVAAAAPAVASAGPYPTGIGMVPMFTHPIPSPYWQLPLSAVAATATTTKTPTPGNINSGGGAASVSCMTPQELDRWINIAQGLPY
ncbi:hypothetical protein HDU86_000348 [Geranomyces michiganensis]|nr:hypothetical protein HDU86_000348 [Geranomyces michiganensis]